MWNAGYNLKRCSVTTHQNASRTKRNKGSSGSPRDYEPITAFNHGTSALLITAFHNSSERLSFKKNYFEIISSLLSCKITTNDSPTPFTQAYLLTSPPCVCSVSLLSYSEGSYETFLNPNILACTIYKKEHSFWWQHWVIIKIGETIMFPWYYGLNWNIVHTHNYPNLPLHTCVWLALQLSVMSPEFLESGIAPWSSITFMSERE